MAEQEIKAEARALALAACERWIDQWEHTERSVVTGWLLVAETVRPNGAIDVTWTTGNGNAIGDNTALDNGLPLHRIDSLARQVSREIDAMEIRGYIREDTE